MKQLMLLVVACGSADTSFDTAPLTQHQHAVKHNMVLVGDAEIFASHIVYKQPHNYQVILRVAFDDATRADYATARRDNPGVDLIFLLDDMHIADIASVKTLSGTILFYDGAGNKQVIRSGVTLEQSEFAIAYFNELPLSLAADHSPQASISER